mmetsp:Transcript_50117/g.139058  ORF Transcript_50117/g.139058 Transcript_50117/m.139058 type:complete len:237 (+) Transcript_50117:178-888(+)
MRPQRTGACDCCAPCLLEFRAHRGPLPTTQRRKTNSSIVSHQEPAWTPTPQFACPQASLRASRFRTSCTRSIENKTEATDLTRSSQPRVRRELLDLVVEPLPGLWRARLPVPGADAVFRGAVCVEARALLSARQHLRATVRLPRRLQPEVGVDDLRVRRLRRREEAHARAADVAPIRALGALVRHAVAPGVHDHVRLEAGDALRHGLPQVQRIVVLVLRRVPLLCEAARVVATRVP